MSAAVRLVLTGDATVAGLVGGRIYPLALPQDPTYPAVRYQRISTRFLPTLSGQLPRVEARIQYDIFAQDPDTADTVAAAIAAALESYGGTSGGVLIHNARREGEQTGYDAELRLYRVIQDWMVTYQE